MHSCIYFLKNKKQNKMKVLKTIAMMLVLAVTTTAVNAQGAKTEAKKEAPKAAEAKKDAPKAADKKEAPKATDKKVETKKDAPKAK
jgi:nitrate reductase cytochrome c-type subunit